MLAIVATNWVGLTNGPMGLPGIEAPNFSIPGLFEFEIESKAEYYYLMITIVAIMTYIIYRLLNSVIGRAAISLRENEALSESVGVSAFYFGMIIFITASVFAGVGGSFYAHYYSYLNPEIFGFIYTISMLVMLITGGKGTIIGPILGCFVFTLMPEVLRGAEAYREPIFAIILIVVAMFLPQGLSGLITQLIKGLQQRSIR